MVEWYKPRDLEAELIGITKDSRFRSGRAACVFVSPRLYTFCVDDQNLATGMSPLLSWWSNICSRTFEFVVLKVARFSVRLADWLTEDLVEVGRGSSLGGS